MITSDDIHAPADQSWKLWHLFKLFLVLCPLKHNYYDIYIQFINKFASHCHNHLTHGFHKVKGLQVISKIAIAAQLLECQ